MKTSLARMGVLGFGMGIAMCARAGEDLPLAAPPPVIQPGSVPGEPPGLRNPIYAPHASRMEVKYYRYAATNGPLFAQGWYPDNYHTRWVNSTTTVGYLRSATGPGGYRIFPVGSYRAQWRGYNSSGYGPWTTSMPFQVTHPSTLTARITAGPKVVGTGGDIRYTWSNNFAATVHQVQILRSGRVVRATNLPGRLQNGWIQTNAPFYADRPASPGQELPNGSTYVFRVHSWSPVLNRWTPWTNRPFFLYRGTASVPRLSYSQRDYHGTFTRSPRPYFQANYGTTSPPALWTYFDIHRKTGNQSYPVKRQWVSRYPPSGCPSSGHGTGVVTGQVWVGGAQAFPDLQAGTYVYRARSWNGPGANQSRWSPWGTATVAQAGTLATPSVNGFAYYNGVQQSSMQWRGVPNAYSYNVAVYRNGAYWQTWRNLDPRVNRSVNIWGSSTSGPVTVNYSAPRLTTGVYRFRTQAMNFGNTTTSPYSSWSSYTPSYTVP